MKKTTIAAVVAMMMASMAYAEGLPESLTLKVQETLSYDDNIFLAVKGGEKGGGISTDQPAF